MEGTESAPVALVFIAVVLFMLLCMMGIWWVQSTAAERGRRANPDGTDRSERMAELEANRTAATKVLRVIAPITALAFVVVVVLAVVA